MRERPILFSAPMVRAKHLGQWPKSKRPLKSRGFEPGRNRAQEGQ